MDESSLLINNIIAFVSLGLIALILLSIPVQIKRKGSEGFKGKGSGFWIREVLIFISSIILNILCIFIHFEIVPTICLCGCGVMASWVGVQELFPKA